MKIVIKILVTILLTSCTSHYSAEWDCGVPKGQSCKSLSGLDKEIEISDCKIQEQIWFSEYLDRAGKFHPEEIISYCE